MDLAAIKERWSKATPGRWFCSVNVSEWDDVCSILSTGDEVIICEHAGCDAEAIANAPTDIAALIGYAEKLEKALKVCALGSCPPSKDNVGCNGLCDDCWYRWAQAYDTKE